MEHINFKGITTTEYIKDDKSKLRVVERIETRPVVDSWWKLFPQMTREHLTAQSSNAMTKTYLWVARPPGIWATIVRYEDELIATTGLVPQDIEWDKVYAMLKAHGNGLICRLSQEVGLVPVFVQMPGAGYMPLNPGFHIEYKNPIDTNTPQGVQSVEETKSNWPTGVVKPFVIELDSAKKLMDENTRMQYVDKYDGIWLLSPGNPIYEIRS